MLGMISAVIGVLVLLPHSWHFQNSTNGSNRFHQLDIFCWRVPLLFQRLTAFSFTLTLGSNAMSAPSWSRKKWYRIKGTTPICLDA